MSEDQLDPQNKSQLEVLREISQLTKSIECEFWLRGGWAIDFLLGRITRVHSDIDLVTWIHQREPLEMALSIAGFEQISVGEQFRERQTNFRRYDVDLSICYLIRTDDGDLIMNGLPEWKWRKDSLSTQVQTLTGVSVHTLNPRQLLEEKIVYEEIGRILRPKDLESKKILHQIIAAERQAHEGKNK